MKLRLGLIGQGREWQSRYQPALRMMQDRFEVRAVYHSIAALADPVAREFRAEVVLGFRSLLQRDDIDAVLFLESDWYGSAPILAACDAGKAVYCGAEVDFDELEMCELRQRVDEAGIAMMTEFPRRFAPATLRLKELIATRLGRPRLLFCHRRLSCEAGKTPRAALPLEVRSKRELLELVDWCSYIVGEPGAWVQAIRHPSLHDQDESDYQVLSLGFGNPNRPDPEVLAQISCGAYIPTAWHEAIAYRPPAAIQVCCEKGLAFVDLPSTLVWFDDAGRHQESLESENPVGQQLLTQFYRAVTSLVRKVGGLDDTLCAQGILRRAEESMRSGTRQPLEFDFDSGQNSSKHVEPAA